MINTKEIVKRFQSIGIDIPEEHIFLQDDSYNVGFELYPKYDFTPNTILAFKKIAKDSIFETTSLDEFILPKDKYLFWYSTSLKFDTSIQYTDDEKRFFAYLKFVLQKIIPPSENVSF